MTNAPNSPASTDYILFVHGVKSRSKDDFTKNTQAIFKPIEAKLKAQGRIAKAVPCFWGMCGEPALDQLQRGLQQSPVWKDLWFQGFRSEEILNFVGDGALYLSRSVGSEVVDCIYNSALAQLQNLKEGDRLHLVTHSWGTVILLDILFAKRWTSEGFKAVDPETWTNVQRIRDTLFGLGSNPGQGLKLGSIHTMGSPIALFNLMNTGEKNSHDIAPDMKAFLQNLQAETGTAMPWNNYIHPGDPIAYPLEGITQQFFQADRSVNDFVKVSDRLVQSNSFGEKVMGMAKSTILSVLYGGTAHNSYWKMPEIPKGIIETIG
jgi:hypothetical protein